MSVTLTSSKRKFFMSGDLNLNPGESVVVDENTLTETQLRDIIFNHDIKELEVDNLGIIQSRLSQLSSKSGGGSGGAPDPLTLKRITSLEQKLKQVEQEVSKPLPQPINTTVKEEVYWSSTDW